MLPSFFESYFNTECADDFGQCLYTRFPDESTKRICLSFKWLIDVITDGRKPQVTFLWLYISLKKALKRGLVSRYVWKKTIQTVLYTMNFHYKTYEMRSATYCGTNQNVKYIFNCSLCSLHVFANTN